MPRLSVAAPAACNARPPVDVIAAAANAVLGRRLDLASPAPVAVALSGGGDSLALMLLAAGWCAANGRPLLALTVDHGLNPDSAAWTRAAGEVAARAGASWRALVWNGPKPSTGLPAASRAARHRLLADAAREAGAKVILTGHTRDDVLEGELMRAADAPTLGRLREWTPSPVWPEGRGVFLLRPLLDQRRGALRDWLGERGHVWLDDPANEDLRHARVRARTRLRPLGEKVSAEPTDEGCGSAWLLPPGQNHASVPSPHPSAPPTPSLPEGRRDGVVELPQADLNANLLAAALLCASGTSRPPRSEPLQRLLARLQAGGPVQATLAGAHVVADGRTVLIGRDAGRGGLEAVVLEPRTPAVWDGRFEIDAAEPGWSVRALAGAMARLSARDRATLKPIPSWARGAVPVLSSAAGSVRLPAPFGGGPAQAVSLAGPRLAAACGLIAREAEIAEP
jgi:tRNA(Ile)-lysidine synthase